MNNNKEREARVNPAILSEASIEDLIVNSSAVLEDECKHDFITKPLYKIHGGGGKEEVGELDICSKCSLLQSQLSFTATISAFDIGESHES